MSTRGRRDVGTSRRGDVDTLGRHNVGTWGRGDVGTSRRWDVTTWGRGDVGTWRLWDVATWGRRDFGTSRRCSHPYALPPSAPKLLLKAALFAPISPAYTPTILIRY